jgi:hypothetical protein
MKHAATFVGISVKVVCDHKIKSAIADADHIMCISDFMAIEPDIRCPACLEKITRLELYDDCKTAKQPNAK